MQGICADLLRRCCCIFAKVLTCVEVFLSRDCDAAKNGVCSVNAVVQCWTLTGIGAKLNLIRPGNHYSFRIFVGDIACARLGRDRDDLEDAAGVKLDATLVGVAVAALRASVLCVNHQEWDVRVLVNTAWMLGLLLRSTI